MQVLLFFTLFAGVHFSHSVLIPKGKLRAPWKPFIGCTRDSCENGECINEITGPTCYCDEGWTGPRCEQRKDMCAGKSICLNGGRCVNSAIRPGAYFCRCQEGWTGLICQTPTCSKDDECLNGGVCSAGVCDCQPNFRGTFCEKETPCFKDACGTFEACVEDRTSSVGYTCQCRVHPKMCLAYKEQNKKKIDA